MTALKFVRTRVDARVALIGCFLAVGAMLIAWAPGQAQSLAQRIASAPDGRVQFTFPSRDGVCGDGRFYLRVNTSGNTNDMYGSFNSNEQSQPCTHGPVRVVLEQASRATVSIRVFVGPPAVLDGATDLGSVRPKEAADFLLALAAKAEGSVSRDAIMPAMLADSVNNQSALLAIARDQSRARETRRSAISWFARDGRVPTALAAPLLAIAKDDADNQSVRQQALRSLARLEGGAGIPQLITLADDRAGGWTAREALTALAQSGDPRSRDYLRQVVRRAELPDDALSTAIRALGQQYATAADVQLVRAAWPKLTGQRSQEATLSAVAEFGGAENTAWLLALSKDAGASANTQRRALSEAVRAGVRVSELVTLYNSTVDFQMKDAVISALAQNGDREATDKLLAIAKADDSITARKKAIAALGRSSDPRVRKELEALAEKNTGRD